MELKPLTIGQKDACEMTGLGRTKLLELAYTGEIVSYKVGNRRLFPVQSLEEWVQDRVEATQSIRPPHRNEVRARDSKRDGEEGR